MRKKLLELFGGGSKISPTITKVDPFVPKNKKLLVQKLLIKLNQEQHLQVLRNIKKKLLKLEVK